MEHPSPQGGASEAGVGLQPLHPAVRRLWWAESAAFAGAVTAATAVIVMAASPPFPRQLLLLVVAGVGFVAAGVVPVLRYRRWGYRLRDNDLWLRRGVLWVTTTVVPLPRLQFVDTRQGPLERLFGLTRLILYTAAPGTSAELPGLEQGEAERLREQLGRAEPDAAAI